MRSYLLLCLLFFSACKQAGKKPVSFDFYPAIKDSVEKKHFLDRLDFDAALFNLAPMYNGIDSIEIRIQPWHAFDPGKDLFMMRLDRSGWRGFHYHTNSYYEITSNGIKVNSQGEEVKEEIPFTALPFIPKCGWKKFEDSINIAAIKSFPAQDSIKTKPHPGKLDGSGFIIQIASKENYRYLLYHFYGKDQHEECQKIYELVHMFQRQLGDAYFWPSHNSGSE